MANIQGSTFLLSAATVTWVRREGTCLDVTVAATALDGSYFTIDAPASHGGANQAFYVWYDLDASSVDPAPAGLTPIEVNVVTGDTAEDVATKTAAALDLDANFRSSVNPDDLSQVLIKSYFGGLVTAPATDFDTTFTFVQTLNGLGGALGKTQGGTEISLEAQSVQIFADQTGQIPQDEVFIGSSVEVTVSLLEMTPARWATIVGSVTGDTFTPAGGSELVGYGTSRLYQSFFDLGGQLILHPSRKAVSDRALDINLWKCAPKPASYNFSGEEASIMEVTFTALPDPEVESAISLMSFGDGEQDVFI